MPTLERIENPQMMEVHVSGPAGANRLFIFAGIAVFNWAHSSRDRWEGWVHEPLHISFLAIPGVPRLYQDQVIQHLETAALASFSFSETSRQDTWGFAVDSVEGYFTDDPDRTGDFTDFGLDIQLALRGYESRLFRVCFQMNVLARI